MFEKSYWERMVLQQLQRECRHVIQLHKLPISGPNLTLMDSTEKWGSYNPQTQTISLARRLIETHPWNHVCGILLHEMAHHLVYLQGFDDEKPHGESFQLACSRLGVPGPFRRSQIDLQSQTLDWRENSSNSESERILEKVRKLLNLAGSSNPHEAMAAMAKVRDIYARYNLQKLSGSQEHSEMAFVHLILTRKKKIIETWEWSLIGILNSFFFVESFAFEQWDANTLDFYKAFEIVGTSENVKMAEYVYHFLMQQLELYCNEHRKMKKGGRRQLRSLRVGILAGFHERLKDLENPSAGTGMDQSVPDPGFPIDAEAKNPSMVAKALALFKTDPQLKSYLHSIYPHLRRRGLRGPTVDAAIFHHGQKLGKSLNLYQPLESKSENLGKLLAMR